MHFKCTSGARKLSPTPSPSPHQATRRWVLSKVSTADKDAASKQDKAVPLGSLFGDVVPLEPSKIACSCKGPARKAMLESTVVFFERPGK